MISDKELEKQQCNLKTRNKVCRLFVSSGEHTLTPADAGVVDQVVAGCQLCGKSSSI